jgi:hypothetical protein
VKVQEDFGLTIASTEVLPDGAKLGPRYNGFEDYVQLTPSQ